MMRLKHFVLTAALVILMPLLAGCQTTTEEWAYVHEPEEEVLSLSSDGKAVYKDIEYTYTKDDSYIHLKGKSSEDLDLRYVIDGDKMILYEKAEYFREGGNTEDGVFGLWMQENRRNLFQFNKDGKFSEENIFFGHFGLDQDNGIIKLMYDEPMQDAILYYTLDGDTLTIEYPWPMVKAGTEQDKK